MTPRRATLTIGVAMLALLLLVGGVVVAALGTGPGTTGSLQLVQRLLPELSFERVEGNWLDGLQVGSLRYRDADIDLELTDLQTRLRWRSLLLGHVRLNPLSAATLRIELSDSEEKDDNSLPLVATPVALRAPEVRLGALEIHSGGEMLARLTELGASVFWLGPELRFSGLGLRWETLQVGPDQGVAGRLALKGDYPLRAQGALAIAELPEPVTVALAGSLHDLQVAASLAAPWPLRATGRVALLDDNLPLQLHAELTKPVNLPEAGDPVQFKTAELTVSGDLLRLQGQFAATLEEPLYGPSALQVQLDWQPEPDQLDAQLVWTPPKGELRGDCRVALADAPGWHCTGQLGSLPLPADAAPLTGELTSDFIVDGRWVAPRLELALTLPELRGRLADQPLQGQLQLDTADGNQWQLRRLELAAGANRVTAEGEFGTSNQLRLQLNAERLQQLYAPLAGSATGAVTIAGELTTPTLAGTLRLDDIRYQALRLERGDIELQLARLGELPSRLAVTAQGLTGVGPAPVQLGLTASGDRRNHSLALRGNAEAQHTELNCRGALAADNGRWQLDCPRWDTSLALDKQKTLSWRLDRTLSAQWQTGPRLELAAFCLVQPGSDARLCLEQPVRYASGRLQPTAVNLTAVPLAWSQPYWPEGLQLANDARAELRLAIAGATPPTLDATLRVDASRWQVADAPEPVAIDAVQAEFHLTEKLATLNANVQSPTLGQLDAELAVTDPRNRREARGRLRLGGMELANLRGMIVGVDGLAGRIDGDVAIGGTLAAPTLDGRLQLTAGALTTELLSEPVQDIELLARFDRQSAEFTGGFKLADSRGNVEGGLDWGAGLQDWALQLALTADRLTLAPLPNSSITVSPQLQLRLAPEEMRVSGTVKVDEGDIRLKELPPDSIDVSQDAVIVGAEPTAESQRWVDVRIDLGNKLRFRGFGADVELAGRLRMHQQPGQLLQGIGEVKVPKGRYRAYGQRLIVRRGSFIFAGPLDNPDLNLEAIRELPPGTRDVVGLRVNGPLQNPTAVLFSEPPRLESETAYYLLTGRPPPEDGGAGQFSAGGTLLSLGLAGTGDRAEKLAERFGITDFQIGTSESETGTEAEVSGYITPRLFVRYGAGLKDDSKSVTLQYRLTPRLLIEAVSGIEEALDILYSFSID